MKKTTVFLTVILMCMSAMAFKVSNSANAVIGQAAEIRCGGNVSCVLNGNQVVMGVNAQTAATATTILASQCGSSFKNSGAVAMKLPEASGVIGCVLKFYVANASNFDIDPNDGTDQIAVYTNAAGDAIRSSTLGSSITLTAVTNDLWFVEASTSGTVLWSDIN